MSRFYTFRKFFEHRIHSRRWDSFHSPYLFSLFSYCCDEKIVFPEMEKIEAFRNKWIHTRDSIKRTDYGAGMTNAHAQNEKRISTIARRSLSLPFQCKFLFRLMKMLKPKLCIEFGTCLGIATSYLAYGAQLCKIITVEGDPVLALMSQKLFDVLDLKNIMLINSTFEDFIKTESDQIATVNFIFLDGNHKSDPLLNYYQALKNHFTTDTIVMVDDIYWSSDMQAAWKKLIGMPEVTQSVDCFQFGLLFFRTDFMDKHHHIIRLPVQSFI